MDAAFTNSNEGQNESEMSVSLKLPTELSTSPGVPVSEYKSPLSSKIDLSPFLNIPQTPGVELSHHLVQKLAQLTEQCEEYRRTVRVMERQLKRQEGDSSELPLIKNDDNAEYDCDAKKSNILFTKPCLMKNTTGNQFEVTDEDEKTYLNLDIKKSENPDNNDLQTNEIDSNQDDEEEEEGEMEGEGEFKCTFCPKSFHKELNLKRHQRYHAGSKPHVCHICNRRFGGSHNLQSHIRTHTGEKPFQCSMCDKRFARKDYLQGHEKVHNQSKTHVCQNCSKAFSNRLALQRHEATHIKERKHRCGVCSRSYPALFQLRCHQRIHKNARSRGVISETTVVKTQPEEDLVVQTNKDITSKVEPVAMPMAPATSLTDLNSTDHTSEFLSQPTNTAGMFQQPNLNTLVHFYTFNNTNIPTDDMNKPFSHVSSGQGMSQSHPSFITMTGATSNEASMNYCSADMNDNKNYMHQHNFDMPHYTNPDGSACMPFIEALRNVTPMPPNDLAYNSLVFVPSKIDGSNMAGHFIPSGPHGAYQMMASLPSMASEFIAANGMDKLSCGMQMHHNPEKHYSMGDEENLPLSEVVRRIPLSGNLVAPPDSTTPGSSMFLLKQRRLSQSDNASNASSSNCSSGISDHMKPNISATGYRGQGASTSEGTHSTRKRGPHCSSMHGGVANSNNSSLANNPGRLHKQYVCRFCGKNFSSNCNLRCHERTHTGEKPYRCTLCDRSFCQVSHLKCHERTHTGERPYTCSICARAFAVLGNMKCHMETHKEERQRPHKCKICSKAFFRSRSLKYHERVHDMSASNVSVNVMGPSGNITVLPVPTSLGSL